MTNKLRQKKYYYRHIHKKGNCKKCNAKIKGNSKSKLCKVCSHKGLRTKAYKGGIKIKDDTGYTYKKDYSHPFHAKNGYVPLHRLIYEDYLNKKKKLTQYQKENTIIIKGRIYLNKGTIIHHIDINSGNNELINLELIVNSKFHKFLHEQISFKVKETNIFKIIINKVIKLIRSKK